MTERLGREYQAEQTLIVLNYKLNLKSMTNVQNNIQNKNRISTLAAIFVAGLLVGISITIAVLAVRQTLQMQTAINTVAERQGGIINVLVENGLIQVNQPTQ